MCLALAFFFNKGHAPTFSSPVTYCITHAFSVSFFELNLHLINACFMCISVDFFGLNMELTQAQVIKVFTNKKLNHSFNCYFEGR